MMNWKPVPGNHETWVRDAQPGDLITISDGNREEYCTFTVGIIRAMYEPVNLEEAVLFEFTDQLDAPVYVIVERTFTGNGPFVLGLRRRAE